MFIYLFICLLITLYAIETFIMVGRHSTDHRLLPLVLGIIGVYDFYVLVEYMSGASRSIDLLKYLLFVQMMFLLFFYILDYIKQKLPIWAYVTVFVYIGVSNGAMLWDLSLKKSHEKVIMAVFFIMSVLIVLFATYTLVSRMHKKKVHKLYSYMYVSMVIPCIGLWITYMFSIPDQIIMPGGLSVFCIIMSYLLSSHQFEDTSKYLKDDFFNQIEDLVFIFDSDMRFVDATRQAMELFGRQIEAICGVSNESVYDNPHADKVREWVKLLSKGEAFEYEGKYYKGQVNEVVSKKRIQGYIIALIDVTAEIANVNEAKRQVKEKGEYLANMSHELRSPLNAIIGGIEIMISEGSMSGKNIVMSQNIRASAYNLLGIVNSILDYSKLENNMVALSPVNYDLRSVLEQQIQNNMIIIEGKSVALTLSAEPGLPKLMHGDENRVRSIIQNLISNAVKYTNDGSIQCNIKCQPEDEKHIRIVFSVKDTGIGISKEDQEKLFHKYNTFSGIQVESTGIGLYLTKYLLELMDGDIEVESDGRTGSTFTVNFVQEVINSEEYAAFMVDKKTLFTNKANIDTQIIPNYIYPQAKILIVDDMKVNRAVLAGKLEAYKANALEANDGKEAVEKALQLKPDLIFMDQMMPVMNGLEAAEKIIEKLDIPIVIVSADTSDAMQKRVMSFEKLRFLPKPINDKKLKNLIEELLPESMRERPAYDMSLMFGIDKTNKGYRLALISYVEELKALIDELEDFFKTDLELFAIKVHGVKGTSKQLGRYNLALYAEILEMSVQSNHMQFAENYMVTFIDEMRYFAHEAETELEYMG